MNAAPNTTARTLRPRAPEPTCEQLMAAYQQGDARAFDALVRRHTRTLLRLLMRDGHGAPPLSQAEDVVQQTFLHVLRARDSFRPGAPFLPWLVAIARNTLKAQRRRDAQRFDLEQRCLALPGSWGTAARAGTAEVAAELSRVVAALGHLPEREREAIEGSIAGTRASHVTTGAHKARLRRGRAKLEELLGHAPRSS